MAERRYGGVGWHPERGEDPEVADFCYTTVPGKIKPLLAKVREVGVPKRAGVQWLKTLGFTSSNDASLLKVLTQIDLIDAGSSPTARWNRYRGADYRSVLAEAIVQGYSELYSVYPDAHRRSNEELDHVFSTHSEGGKQVISKTISTFKALVELADFSATPQTAAGAPTARSSVPEPSTPANAAPGRGSAGFPDVHIDLQIHISPEASADQIDKVFESIARHLYRAGKPRE
jgi:hypothetical protein